jgi:hypothetical protein
MKICSLIQTLPAASLSALLLLSALPAAGQIAQVNTPSDDAEPIAPVQSVVNGPVPPFVPVERGDYFKRYEQVLTLTNLSGPAPRIQRQTNSFTAIATALHRQVGGQWIECSPELALSADGSTAFSTNTAHGFALASDPSSAIAAQLTLPGSGTTLSARVLCLAYLDPSTGQAVLLAEITNSVGQLVQPSQVIFPGALVGDCEASLLYENTLAGPEQCVVMTTQLPQPQEYNLLGSNILLEVMTEFFDPPEPSITTNWVSLSPDGPVFLDENLDFGMRVGVGRAFLIGNADNPSSPVRVLKRWATIENRHFLLEQVPVAQIASQLQGLPPPPPPAGLGPAPSGGNAMLHRRIPRYPLVAHVPIKDQKSKIPKFALADTKQRPAGFLIDFSILQATTNMVFQADTTYVVTNLVNLYGQTVCEGNCVAKFSTNSTAKIVLNSTNVICKTGPYYPFILTGDADWSAGDIVSTNALTNWYGGAGLVLASSSGFNLSNFRLSHLRTAFDCTAGGTNAFSDLQIVSCQTPFALANSTIALRNALVYDSGTNFSGAQNAVEAENVTFHQSAWLAVDPTSTSTIALTNCLLATVTNLASNYTVTTNTTAILASDSGVFQTVGGASHYLIAGSPYRGAGSTNVNPSLLTDLSQRTTEPPIVFFGVASIFPTNSLNLFPQAARETGWPDVGFAYAPLDFAFGACYVTNISITVNPGTAIGLYSTNTGSGSGTWGLVLDGGAQFASIGTPNNPNWLVRASTVQECANTNWNSGSSWGLADGWIYLPEPVINCRFTSFSMPAHDAYIYYAYLHASPSTVARNFQDCHMRGGSFGSTYEGLTVNLTNCLFERIQVDQSSSGNPISTTRNCLFVGGIFDFDCYPATNAVVRDNLFDQATIWDNSNYYTSYSGGYNAFVTNHDRLLPTNAADIVIAASPAYQTGPLGSYYYPSGYNTLIDKGSTNASVVGLWHFCTTTNELPETNSIVDVGFHLVVVGTNGLPISTGGSGIPDYLADSNGNGIYDPAIDLGNWQTNNTSGSSDGVSDYIKWIEGRNIKVTALPVADTNGVTGLNVYTPLK